MFLGEEQRSYHWSLAAMTATAANPRLETVRTLLLDSSNLDLGFKWRILLNVRFSAVIQNGEPVMQLLFVFQASSCQI